MKKTFVHDYGRAEYLDGAQMQYSVLSGPYPGADTLAYFARKRDALLFARARGAVVVQSNKTNWQKVRARHT